MSEDDQHVEAVIDVVNNNNVNDPPSAGDRHVGLTLPPTYEQLPPQYSAVDQSTDSACVSGSLVEPSTGKKSGMALTSETEDCADKTCTCGQCWCTMRGGVLVFLFLRGLNRPTTPNVRGLFWRPRTLLRPRMFWLQIRNLGRKFDVLAKFICVLGSIVLSRNSHTSAYLSVSKHSRVWTHPIQPCQNRCLISH